MKRLDLGKLVESRRKATWREWKAEWGGGFGRLLWWVAFVILLAGVKLAW